jgi:hypothetical protein
MSSGIVAIVHLLISNLDLCGAKGNCVVLKLKCGLLLASSLDDDEKLEKRLWLSHEIRTTVYRQEIPIVEFADTPIPTAAASYRTEDADTLKKLFQHNWVVIEVLTVSAAMPI